MPVTTPYASMNSTAQQIVDSYTDEQRDALRRVDARFPGSVTIFWKSNVIHGEQVLGHAPRGRAIFMSDVSDALMRLCSAGIICPIRFAPSRSGAALLGLDSANRRQQKTPNAGTAAHWEWEALGPFDVFDLVIQELPGYTINRKD